MTMPPSLVVYGEDGGVQSDDDTLAGSSPEFDERGRQRRPLARAAHSLAQAVFQPPALEEDAESESAMRELEAAERVEHARAMRAASDAACEARRADWRVDLQPGVCFCPRVALCKCYHRLKCVARLPMRRWSGYGGQARDARGVPGD